MTLLQQPASNPLLTAPSYDNPPSDFQTAPQNAATDLFRGLRGAALNSSADSAAVDYYKALQRGDTASAKKHGLRAQQLLQEAAENAPSVQSTGDVHDFGSGVRYVAGQLGALPVGVASPAAAGALGSLGGAVIALRYGLRGLPVVNTLASVGGAVGATGAMAHGLRNAAAMQHFQAGDTQAPGDVLDQSAVQGVAQALPYAAGPVAALPGRVVGRTLLPAAKTMGGALARGAAMNAGMGAGSEYIGQKFQDQWNPNRDRSHDNQGLIDAAVGNAVAAVPFEVPGHMFDKAHQASGAVFDAAKRAAPQVLQKGADAAKGVWANRPESLEKAGAMAGAMFGELQNRGEDVATAAAAKRFTKDADIDTLLSPQDGMRADEIAQDDDLKHGAATNLVAKLGQGLHDAPDYVRAAADEYVKGKRDEDSWRGLAAAVNDWQRNTYLNRDMGEMFGEKWQKGMARVGELAGTLRNAKDAAKDGYDTARGEAGRSNAQTPLEMNALVRDQRDEFSAVLEKALTPQLKGFDGTVGQDIAAQNLSHGLRLWATNGFKLSKDAQPEVPARMAEYFKDPVAAVGTALDLMERQGVIPPVSPKTKERLLYVLQAKTEAQKSSIDIVAQNLVPTLQDRMRMPQVQGVVNEVLRQIESGKVDRGYVTNHFGPKAQFVLDALGEQQRRLGEVEREGASGRVQASRESDEQKDNAGHEELAGMTDPFTPNEVAADTKWHHYNESQGLPYEVGGKIIDLKNIDPETGEYAVKGSHDDHADAKIAELKAKNPGSTYEKVPYMDALAERYGYDTDEGIRAINEAYSKLAAKHGRLSNEEVNKRFYVLREKTARGGEATDVHPDTLRVVDPRNKRENVWAEHVARDAKGERVGGTAEEGKIWLRTADGREFATSTAKIIKHVSKGTRIEQGNAGDGRGSGTAGQVDMLHQGLASLLAAQADGNAVLAPVIGFRSAEGTPIKWSKPGAALKIPDDLLMYSKTGATYGEAKLELAAQNMQRHADAARTQIEARVKELTSRLEGRRILKETDAQAWFGEKKRLENLLKKGTPEALVAEANALEARVEGEQKIFSSKQSAGPTTDFRSERTQNEPHRPLAPKVGPDGQRARSKWRSDEPAGTESQIVFKDHTVTTDHEGNVFRSRDSAEAFMRKEGIEGKVRKLGGKLLDNWVIDTKIRAVDPKPSDVALETQEMMAERTGSASRSLSEDLADPDKPRTNEDHTGEEIGSKGVAGSLGPKYDKAGNLVPSGKPSEIVGAKKGDVVPVEPQRDAVAEKAADAEKTQFMLDALRKGIPAFNRVIEKATDGQRAAMADRLRAMLDAKSANSPVWGGQPPKDMDAFTARANLALERLTGGVLAKKGVIQENPVRFDKKGKVEATLAAKKKARPAEKPVDEPVKAAPQNILEGAIKRHTEYLENPPDDYTPAEAQKRGQWAEKQLARVQAELDKLKGSDDYDRQDQLSDYKSALKRLVAKAKEIVEADVHLEKELGPQDGEAKYNAQVPYAKDNPYGGVRDGRDNFQAGHVFDWEVEKRILELRDAGKAKEADTLERLQHKAARVWKDDATGELMTAGGVDLPFARELAQRYGMEHTLRELDKLDPRNNTELPDLPHGASKEEVEAFHAAVARRFNGAVTSAVHELLTGKNAKGEKIPLSGKWVKGAIHASRYAKNIGQVGAHESFHEFFNRLREAARFMVPKGETPPDSKTMTGASKIMSILDRAANSEPVVRQLQRLLDGEHEALKQIENGAKDYAEERMAYMFQFHQAGLLKLGPETQNVFQRINKFFRKILGVLDNDQKAEAIMRSFDEGKMPTADAAARVLATNIEAREHLYKQVNEALSPLTDKLSRLANTTETNLKRAGAPQYDQVRRLFKRSVGEDGEQGFLDAKDHKMKLYMNKVANIFHGLEPKDLELAAKYLHSGKPATDPVVKGIVAKVKGELLPELEKYMREAGVKRLAYDEATGNSKWEDFGHVEGYFPRALDTGLLMKDPNAVVADLVKWNGAELQKMADDFNAVAAKAGGDLAPRTADDVAKGLLNRLTNSFGQPDLQESTSSVGMSPFMQAVNKRELHWLAPEFLEKYGDKDVARVLTGYVAQAVKRAEYTRRFGPDGKVLKDLLTGGYEHNVERFQTEGLSKEKAEARALKIAEGAAKDVMAMEGTLGYDIGPKMRKFQNSMLVYQNLRVLSTSLFSQFIDPMGMVVRGAEMSDAWNAYKRGLKEVLASFKGEHISDKDSLIADQVGTTDAGGALAAFGQLYSSQYMGAWFRKANDMLFKYNGMEGFNRGMQVAGTRAAINFVKRHVERAMKGDERSADYLKELNLDAKEVKIDKDGDLDYTNPKIQDALHQWVNGSVMRPNAAQRTAWGSDPHYMIFWHMKQFAYTFHDVIMKRAIHDAKKYGDMGPAGVLVAAYTPIMIASDALKNVLLTGQEPGWMRAGLPSEIEHGAMRAGLMGKFQPLGDVALNPSRSVLGLGGPVVEQIAQMMDQSPKDIALNAAPGANLLNMWMGNNHIEVQGED